MKVRYSQPDHHDTIDPNLKVLKTFLDPAGRLVANVHLVEKAWGPSEMI